MPKDKYDIKEHREFLRGLTENSPVQEEVLLHFDESIKLLKSKVEEREAWLMSAATHAKNQKEKIKELKAEIKRLKDGV